MRKNPRGSIELLVLCMAVAVSLVAAGCDRNDLLKLEGYSRDTFMQTNTAQLQERLARQTAELLRQGQYDKVVRALRPDVVNPQTRQSLIAMHDMLAGREPTSIKVIDARKSQQGFRELTEIVLDYEFPPAANATSGSGEHFPARWVFVTFDIESRDGAPDRIQRLDMTPSDQPIEEINAFTFENKGISQYAAFAIAVVLLAFTIYAVILCIRWKIGRRKWLWVVFMLFTVTLVSVNWTSGEWSFNRISFTFGVPPIPANLSIHSGYGPWNLTLGLPVGAIVFVLYRSFRRRTSSATARLSG